METDADEWRFQWGVDPRDGRQLFQIEHDVRSMKHRGRDAFRGTY
jgi:hypothetical protein